MKLLVDTREQPTERLRRRLRQIGLPYERRKLEQGDYSCQCILPDETILDFSNKVAIERKMNIDELCLCFGKERKRFEKEFERAKENGCRLYLLVEDGSWEKVYSGKYRSLYGEKALVASINAFRARYGVQLDFCKSETTGKLIKDILYRELKEYLQGGAVDIDKGGN
jgi:ERCC4-type nuclease